jgi:hypothetical protein
MSRRLIVAIVVFSVLGYGTAWAFHGHAVKPADHFYTTEHDKSGPQTDQENCDHCCHVSAHVIGLVQQGPFISFPATEVHLSQGTSVYVTRSTAPPLKPPQS